MTDRYNGLASPIPDPTATPKPETGGKYGSLASGIPADPKAETKTEPTSESKPDADEKPKPDSEQKSTPNRDGKIPAEMKPAPDAGETPKPDADKLATKTTIKPVDKLTASDDYKTIGKSFGKAYLEAAKSPIKGIPGIMKAEYKAGIAIGDKLAGKIAGETLIKKAGKMSVKTMARLLPGVGAVYGAIQVWNSAKQGDIIGGALGFVSMIPGPIGWVGLAGSVAWDAFDRGTKKIQMWDQPDGETTHILPGSAKDIGGVQQLDQQLRIAQQSVYSFKDGPNGTVWDSNPPAALRLDTPAVEKAITQWLGGIADLFTEVDQVMGAAGEQYFTEYQARLRPHIDAMTGLRDQVKPFTQQLTSASDGAETAYQAVLDANRAAREQLVADGKLSDQGPAVSFSSSVAAAVSKVEAADRKISDMFGEPVAALTPAVQTGAGTGNRNDPSKKEKPVQTTPAPTAPAPVTPTSQTPTPAKTETPQKTTSDALGDLLRTLNQKTAPPASPVSTPNLGNGLGGGSPLGNTGGSPLSTSPSKSLDDSGDKKLDDGKKKGEDKKVERKLAEPKGEKPETKPSLSASQTDNKVTKPITTETKPGNATTVPAQPAAAAANPAAAAAQGPAAPPEPSKEVDVKGSKTTFPDAKTAKMAQLLAAADPAHPLSLAEAAKAAGLTPPVPGQDPGSQVAPAQAKPGDLLVAGDKSYLLLGDGKFYDLQEYKVVNADQLPQDMGSRGGYFHLNDPAPGAVPGTQPVSGQTAGVDQAVPGGTPAPAAPADASTPAKPADPAPAPGAPAPAPAAGVPSTGTPGAPKPAAGGGPASAESTQTGTGQTAPSPSTSALDPSAVR
ncbi:hypothetical protein A5637_16295 [Mycolicibacterium fortuitum]|uniref:hypothetical protein n=1 Tax=Mycolicibacterium fortuitum TaxID=1766 RepID=UPI0007ED2226|nr:hypothetical protein [Mycolicibacterium fortuitum]OBK02772.1 hypothetical protein A5637_16295 [Mycolicibacterium fortuitum]